MVGVVELVLAGGLVLRLEPVLVATFAAVLLWGFAIVIARSLRANRHFPCHCFGGADSAEISGFTLIRTIAFASVASGIALTTSRSATKFDLARVEVVSALSALSALAIVVLLATIPRLVRIARTTIVSLEARIPNDGRTLTS